MTLRETASDGPVTLLTATSLRDGSETVDCAIEADGEQVYRREVEHDLGDDATISALNTVKALYRKTAGAARAFDAPVETWNTASEDAPIRFEPASTDDYAVDVAVTPEGITISARYVGTSGRAERVVGSPDEMPSLSMLKDEAYQDSGEPQFVTACVEQYDDYFDNEALQLSWDGRMMASNQFGLTLQLHYGSKQIAEETYSVDSPHELPTPWQRLGKTIDTWRTAARSELSLPATSTVEESGVNITETWERTDGATVTLYMIDLGDDWNGSLAISDDDNQVQVSAGDTADVASIAADFEAHRERYEELQATIE